MWKTMVLGLVLASVFTSVSRAQYYGGPPMWQRMPPPGAYGYPYPRPGPGEGPPPNPYGYHGPRPQGGYYGPMYPPMERPRRPSPCSINPEWC